MKKLNFILLIAIGLFLAGTQSADAQEDKKEELKENVKKTTDSDEAVKAESTPLKIKEKPETKSPKKTEGEAKEEEIEQKVKKDDD